MGSGIFFPALSLVYSLLLIFLCFRKKSIKNKYLKMLVVTNFIGLISEIMCSFAAFNIDKLPVLSNILLKLYLVYLITWIILFTKYISNISKTKVNRLKFEKIVFRIVYVVSCILVFILPIYLFNEGEVRYTYGPSVNVVYTLSFAFIIYCLLLMFFNINKKVVSRYSSLFILISLGAFAMIIQSTYPGLLLITSVSTFVTFIMYLNTFENEVLINIENDKKTKLKEGKIDNESRSE